MFPHRRGAPATAPPPDDEREQQQQRQHQPGRFRRAMRRVGSTLGLREAASAPSSSSTAAAPLTGSRPSGAVRPLYENTRLEARDARTGAASSSAALATVDVEEDHGDRRYVVPASGVDLSSLPQLYHISRAGQMPWYAFCVRDKRIDDVFEPQLHGVPLYFDNTWTPEWHGTVGCWILKREATGEWIPLGSREQTVITRLALCNPCRATGGPRAPVWTCNKTEWPCIGCVVAHPRPGQPPRRCVAQNVELTADSPHVDGHTVARRLRLLASGQPPKPAFRWPEEVIPRVEQERREESGGRGYYRFSMEAQEEGDAGEEDELIGIAY